MTQLTERRAEARRLDFGHFRQVESRAQAAAAETPGGSHDFEGEEFLGCVFGVELVHEAGEDFGVFLFFSFADEIVGVKRPNLRLLRADFALPSSVRGPEDRRGSLTKSFGSVIM